MDGEQKTQLYNPHIEPFIWPPQKASNKAPSDNSVCTDGGSMQLDFK